MGNFKAHSVLHTKGKNFKCTFQGCGKLFCTQGILKTHLKTHVLTNSFNLKS
jgi:uncharacterized Zn-finger protein